MAKKISQLTQATEVKSDDVTVIVQDGETKKLPLNMMVTKQDIENKKVAGLAKLDEIEATYENDTYTPTITVKNKSSVKVGEGDGVDYSANVMDGHAKSAILTGQTLVNILPSVNDDRFLIKNSTTLERLEDGFLRINAPHKGSWEIVTNTIPIKPSTKYLLITEVKNNTVDGLVALANATGFTTNSLTKVSVGFNGVLKQIITTKDVLSEYVFQGWLDSGSSGFVDIRNTLIEYQDGIENWDIPYFTGMQSVKMPVLKTTGKNLFELPQSDEMLNGRTGKYIKLNLKANTNYTYNSILDKKGNASEFDFYGWISNDINSNYTGYQIFHWKLNKTFSKTFNTGNDEWYFHVYGEKENDDYRNYLINFQLEEGTVATTYEPYKTNILTANEDVTLRGIGDVQDTLDCLTGEVTERIGEIVLDGSDDEGYTINGSITSDGLTRFIVNVDIPNRKQRGNAISNLLPTVDNSSSYGVFNGVGLNIIINCSTVDELRTWLQQNPVTIQYELTQESVKTVDLMPSGTHPSTTPYCWKSGHIQLSSSGLLPNLEYSVVTSRAGQINQNATMIVKNDKRIFDLEILLAGGLVNTTYQALTLQNQVETGLSKVSLNSETEPDYLLYHMIMKLIEEKAYKLDDLTEKVSVFYLYEKLSDEQFETIYSALYPFVEDEIVEEPVVEELPEVVEDEVIM